MAQNQQLDGLHLDSLDLPYNTQQNPLVEKPRIAVGSNTYVKWGGAIAKRPGTVGITGSGFTKRIDRMWIYQTIESSPKVYLLASAYNTAIAKWEMFYLRLDAVTPAWTKFDDLRDVNFSTAPHECVVARGFAYIKGLPASGSSEKLGSVRFNGTGGTAVYDYWGLLPLPNNRGLYGVYQTYLKEALSTSGAVMAVDGDFTGLSPYTGQWWVGGTELLSPITGSYSSAGDSTYFEVNRYDPYDWEGSSRVAHDIGEYVWWYSTWTYTLPNVNSQVYYGWKYSLSLKSRTGQLSNRTPMVVTPKGYPTLGRTQSDTGRFWMANPIIFLNASGDTPPSTTYVPHLSVFRTTDGGGTFFLLKDDVDNGGLAIDQIFTDNPVSVGVYGLPLPDEHLSANELAPSTTSNSPPPTCNAPLVTGTDNPQPYSPIAYYAGRIWYGINEVLYFSAQEELTMGVPEESFPSGLRGNFFRYSHPIKNVVATTDALYIFTTNGIHQITGTNRESFNSRPVLENVGVPEGQARAAVRMGDVVAFLANDERILLLENNTVIPLTDPIGAELSEKIVGGGEIGLKYYKNGSYEWLIVNSFKGSDTTASAQYVCDLKRSRESGWKEPFWYTPWTIRATACVAGRVRETETRHRLIWYIWNGTNGSLCYLDDEGTTFTDAAPLLGGDAALYSYSWGTNLLSIPPGNHVNALRRPAINPVFHHVQYERKKFSGDLEPIVTCFLDDDYNTPGITVSPLPPSRRMQSAGYVSMIAQVRNVAQRVAVRLGATSNKGAEFYNLGLVWNAEGGT